MEKFKDPDMTGRNWQARIQPEFMSIRRAILLERDRLFELELTTGEDVKESETLHLAWLESEQKRGVKTIVTNF